MKGQNSSSARVSGVFFLVAGIMMSGLLCWELFMQSERRDEQQAQRIEDLRADAVSQPRPASEFQVLETLGKLHKNRSGVAWKRLRGSTLKNIKVSIRKDRPVPPSPDIPAGEPMR